MATRRHVSDTVSTCLEFMVDNFLGLQLVSPGSNILPFLRGFPCYLRTCSYYMTVVLVLVRLQPTSYAALKSLPAPKLSCYGESWWRFTWNHLARMISESFV